MFMFLNLCAAAPATHSPMGQVQLGYGWNIFFGDNFFVAPTLTLGGFAAPKKPEESLAFTPQLDLCFGGKFSRFSVFGILGIAGHRKLGNPKSRIPDTIRFWETGKFVGGLGASVQLSSKFALSLRVTAEKKIWGDVTGQASMDRGLVLLGLEFQPGGYKGQKIVGFVGGGVMRTTPQQPIGLGVGGMAPADERLYEEQRAREMQQYREADDARRAEVKQQPIPGYDPDVSKTQRR